MDRTPKETALLEQVAQLVQQYEDKVANLRVALTQQSQQIEQLQKQLQEEVESKNESVQETDEDIPTDRA